jgi:hypothetical protein
MNTLLHTVHSPGATSSLVSVGSGACAARCQGVEAA